MKKIILLAGLLSAAFSFGQNKLLNQDYWKAKPNVQTVQADIAAGNSPSEQNQMQFDPVTMAILNDAPLETIIYLISQKGNSTNKPTHDGRIYLHWAAMRNNAPLVEYLLRGGSDITTEDTGGRTPFQFGAAGMSRETLEKFLNGGLPLNYRDENGANLLMLTAGKDTADLELTKFLINKGVNPLDKDKGGKTFVDYAARMGNVDLLKNLTANKYPVTDNAVLMAAQGGRAANPMPVFVYLVETLRLNPGAVDQNGRNALHYLIGKENSAEQVNYFLGKKVSITQQDKEGNTVLNYAARSRNSANLMTLLQLPEAKSVINKANMAGITPILAAAQSGSPEVLQTIAQLGGDMGAKDAKGNSILNYVMESFSERNKDSVPNIQAKLNFLKSRNFDFKTKDANGETLLHLAAMKDQPELMKTALEYSKDLNAQNKDGNTPLMEAAAVAKSPAVMQSLLQAGADKNMKNTFEETAYTVASENEMLQKSKTDLSFLR